MKLKKKKKLSLKSSRSTKATKRKKKKQRKQEESEESFEQEDGEICSAEEENGMLFVITFTGYMPNLVLQNDSYNKKAGGKIPRPS